MNDRNEKTIKQIAVLLSNNDFFGARLLFDIEIEDINKQNFNQKLDIVKEAIKQGRENRIIIDNETKEDILLEKFGLKNETFSSLDMDQEAKLIVYVGQSIINQLELDNMCLYSETEVKGILEELNDFISKNAFGDWFDSDDLDWRNKNVKTN